MRTYPITAAFALLVAGLNLHAQGWGDSHADGQPSFYRPLTLALAEPETGGGGGAPGESGPSMTELNKELVNPVSTLWSMTFLQNNYWLDTPPGKPNEMAHNLLFQPVLPLSLTEDWNLINHPVFTLVNSVPYANSQGTVSRTTGFGDTTLVELVSPGPSLVGPWLLGLGPSAIFPTAANTHAATNNGRRNESRSMKDNSMQFSVFSPRRINSVEASRDPTSEPHPPTEPRP